MHKLGIIGGMTWSSTALYYDHINREIARRLGGLHSGRIAIESLDFDEIAAMEFAGDWDGIGECLVPCGSERRTGARRAQMFEQEHGEGEHGEHCNE